MKFEEFYKLYNNAAIAEYQTQKEQLKTIALSKPSRNEEGLVRYVRDEAKYLYGLIQLEEKYTDEYLKNATFAELEKDQLTAFGREQEQYERSNVNPQHMSQIFGNKLGPILAALSYQMNGNARYALRHMRFGMCWNQALFLDAAALLVKGGRVHTAELTDVMRKHKLLHLRDEYGLLLHRNCIFDSCGGEDIIRENDWTDPGMLYAFGTFVSADDIRLSRFMAELPQEDIDKMARSFVEGYRRGFFADAKDILRKKTVGIVHRLGMERMTKRALELFGSEIHYIPFVRSVYGTAHGEQCSYDHRFDSALFLDEEYLQAAEEALKTELEQNAEMLSYYGGPAVIESFGEEPFTPKLHGKGISVPENKQPLYVRYNRLVRENLEKYTLPTETSFTIVAYPVPQIGPDFEEIFKKTLEINTLDNETYLQAQQKLIDALDSGEYVEIKGSEGNETDLRVALQPIRLATRQTNFYNCVADVNIPVGEVFTSPRLEGTSGVLHVDSFYDSSLEYKNLKLTFTDGYVTDYACSNFSSAEDGRKYVRENLLFPHETLPMGEFAIGTNTIAYSMARNYGIVQKMPILILEKTGPHFAIGDTCYVGTEDLPVYNPVNGKEVVARENEKTSLRKDNPEEAYTRTHIDITLPYNGIGYIRVIREGKAPVYLLENGRFVLPGTEFLNQGLDRLRKESTNE